jgi:hypothetical protein
MRGTSEKVEEHEATHLAPNKSWRGRILVLSFKKKVATKRKELLCKQKEWAH